MQKGALPLRFLASTNAIRSILLGLAGFFGAFLSVSISLPPLSITVLWSYALPLLASMAYGAKFGLVSGLVGLGAFFPFLLWPGNGWANVVTAVLYLLLYVWFGYFADVRQRQATVWNHPLTVSVPFLGFYFAATLLLYPVALAANPPFWTANAITGLPPAVLVAITTKGTLLMGLIIVCDVALLKLPLARSLLDLPVTQESRLNNRIFAIALLGVLALWAIWLMFNRILVDRNFPQGLFQLADPREFIGLLIMIAAGFFLGYVASLLMEMRLQIDQNLVAVNDSLERRVQERTSELTALHQELVAQVDEMRQSRQQLRDTNAYLENLLNYANAPIIVWDPQFRIVRFNHAFEQLTGRSETEVLGQSLGILFPEAFAAESMALINKTLTGERWETVEIAILHRDGSVRTVLWNSATLFAEDHQTPIATIAQGNDITERKRVEAALKASESRYRALMMQSSEALALIDIETQELVEINHRFTELLGYSLPEDAPLYVNKLVIDTQTNIDRRYSITLHQQHHLPIENLVFRHKNGTEVYIERAGTVISIDGRDYLLASGRDMTAERQQQAELTRNVEFARRVQRELLTELPDSLFVDIRTLYYPVNFVSGDSYHLEWRNDGRLLRGFLIDVSGHGLSTAIQTASLNVLLHEIKSVKKPMLGQLRTVNARAANYFADGSYAAILGFELDLTLQELRYVGAGITQFFINGRKVETPGMFVGLWENAEFISGTLPVAAGDCLYFLTDGFTDLLNQPENSGLWSPDGKDFAADMASLQKIAENGMLRDDASGVCLKIKALL
jgi:PAS domain S-box-containing protein